MYSPCTHWPCRCLEEDVKPCFSTLAEHQHPREPGTDSEAPAPSPSVVTSVVVRCTRDSGDTGVEGTDSLPAKCSRGLSACSPATTRKRLASVSQRDSVRRVEVEDQGGVKDLTKARAGCGSPSSDLSPPPPTPTPFLCFSLLALFAPALRSLWLAKLRFQAHSGLSWNRMRGEKYNASHMGYLKFSSATF